MLFVKIETNTGHIGQVFVYTSVPLMLILSYSLKGITMAHIGKIYKFNENSNSFENYFERLLQFLVTNEVEDEKVAVFSSIISQTTYGVLKNLIQSE